MTPWATVTDAIRGLHVDDIADFTALVAELLPAADERLEVVSGTDAEAGLERFDAVDIDSNVAGYQTPGMDGRSFLEAVRGRDEQLSVILFTGKGSE